jgi:DNA-binding IclR family transcriptional regulator
VLDRADRRVDVRALWQRLDAVLDLGATHGRVMVSDSDMRKQFSRVESSGVDGVVRGSESKASVGTLARGLDILELCASDSSKLTQKEISDTLGMPVATVHRLTKLLIDRGWLVRDPTSRRLRLGLGVAGLIPALLLGLQLPDLARDHLRAMADRTGETVNLAVLHEGAVVYLVSEDGSRLLTQRAPIGLRLPVHCTALGKCLLSQLSDEQARRTAGRQPYRALTPRTITSWDELRGSLEQIRRDGVAFSHQEYEEGLDSIAVPVAWIGGDGPVAVNVSLPSSRARGEAAAALTRDLRATAEAIEAAAGIADGRRPFAGAVA